MKKLVITLLVLAVLGLGYLQLRSFRFEYRSTRGESARVGRGDLMIPINATGQVQPKSRREIKAEASGEVERVFCEAGDVAKAGDLLVRLKRDDEERSVERAQQDVKRAQANLDRARITRKERETSGLQAASARLEALKARLIQVEHDKKRIEKLYDTDNATDTQLYRTRSAYEELLAQIKAANADLMQAEMAIELAQKDVDLAEAAFESAKTTLGDAEKRLAKTDIIAPVDGMVCQVAVKEGEVIQGGKTTFTGGTVLAVLADWSERYVRAEVDEADIGVVLELAPTSARPGDNLVAVDDLTTNAEVPIQTGSPVKISVEAFPEEEFLGTIERIYPEPRKQASVVTYLVDIKVVSENSHKLMSAMQADVEFTAQSVYDVVLVPHEAIKRGPNNELGVFLAIPKEGQKHPEPQFARCKLGLDNGMFAQVIEGVKEGALVFTKLPEKTEKEREEEEENSE